MPTGVLDEIELQSKRVIEQKKREVAELANYQTSLQKAIDECNTTLASLQAEKKKLEASIQSLKADEGAQRGKIDKAEQEAQGRLNEFKAKLAKQADEQTTRVASLDERDKEIGRRERNLEAERAKIKSLLVGQGEAVTQLLSGLIAKLG